MKKFFLSMAFVAALVCGCQKINDLDSRMNSAESDIAALKSDIAKLQAAVDAKITVTSYKATADGYALSMSDGSTINLINGKDGKNGADGAPGAPGANGADGDAFFESVEPIDGMLAITLVDGSFYLLPLADVLGSITSFVFLPEYTDGLATNHTIDGTDITMVEMSVMISPASAAKVIEENMADYDIAIVAAGYETRAVELVKCEPFLTQFEGNVLTVIALASGISSDAQFAVQISSAANSIVSNFVGVRDDIVGVKVGEDVYTAAKMKDGKYWMTQNLHYVPEGVTPCADLTNVTAGVYMPVVVNEGHTAAMFGTAEDALYQGYLYQSEFALGLQVGDITTVEQAEALEGAQGICPKGWHIPTSADILGLVGKAVSPYTTNEDAPYYDKAKKNATFDLLEADGFNPGAWGAVTIQDNTKTSATLTGWLKAKPEIIGSGFMCGSTYAGVTYNTAGDAESGIKNIQFLGLMPMASTGTFNGSKLSYRIAASVRCVKD